MKWIAITYLYFNDLRTFSAQPPDSKPPHETKFSCSSRLQHPRFGPKHSEPDNSFYWQLATGYWPLFTTGAHKLPILAEPPRSHHARRLKSTSCRACCCRDLPRRPARSAHRATG